MAQEATPPSVSTVGNLRITFVPSGSNPLSAAVLGGAIAKDITYSLTPGGWRPNTTEASISDGRMTQRQILSRKGNFSQAAELQYVYGTPTQDVAYAALKVDVIGFLVVRASIDNATAWAAAQIADVWAIQCGFQRKDPPAENALQTVTQGLYITAPTQVDATLVA